jgi:hypothetical protein
MAKKKCVCETRSGKKCKNFALQYSDYCSVHQNCVKDVKDYKKGRRSSVKRKGSGRRRSPRGSVPPPQYRCACTNKDGTKCRKWTTVGSLYCNVHAGCVPVTSRIIEVARPAMPSGFRPLPGTNLPRMPLPPVFDDSAFYDQNGQAKDIPIPARAAAPAQPPVSAAASAVAGVVGALTSPLRQAAGDGLRQRSPKKDD